MGKMSNYQLQAALDSLAAAVNRAHVARSKIMEHCEVVYGVVPGDVNNDQLIDFVDGGNASAAGMTVDEFDQSMPVSMSRAGIRMPNKVSLSQRTKHRR